MLSTPLLSFPSAFRNKLWVGIGLSLYFLDSNVEYTDINYIHDILTYHHTIIITSFNSTGLFFQNKTEQSQLFLAIDLN